MAFDSVIFVKKSPHIFSNIDSPNFIVCQFRHFKQILFKKLKNSHLEPFKPVSIVFHFLHKCGSIGHKLSVQDHIFISEKVKKTAILCSVFANLFSSSITDR